MRQVGYSAPSSKGIIISDPPIQRRFLRLQLGWLQFLTQPFKGVFSCLQLGGPKLLVPLLLGAPKGLPKVDFRVCESAKLSAFLNFGCAKVLNYQWCIRFTRLKFLRSQFRCSCREFC